MPGRLLSFLGSDSIQQKRMVDVILMTALADDTLSDLTYDLIAKAMQKHSELAGLSWDWVVGRAEELALDAPLFSDTRALLKKELVDRSLKKLSISLAAKIVGAGRPLQDAERAILTELALAFDMDADAVDELLAPSAPDEAKGFFRAACNHPTAPEAPSIFDAIAKAETDDEVRMLTYKLCAIRRIIDTMLPDAELVGVSQGFRLGPHFSRVDAVLDLPDAGQCILRCLADGEALHPGEHDALAGIFSELKTLSFLMIAHQGSIAPMDQAFLDGLDRTRLRVEKVDIFEVVT